MENLFAKKEIPPLSTVGTKLATPQNRVASVDVYRGFVMLLMLAEVLSFDKIANAIPDNNFWQFLYFQQSHAPWTMLALHDMIQPSFTFLVGVVLPYSIASRKTKGATTYNLLMHTFKRSFLLIVLGIFLRSIGDKQTYFTFEDTLTQIGLGYTFLVLLSLRSQRFQIITLIILLIGYWLAFALYPLPDSTFNYSTSGVTPNWSHNLQGFSAHWNKNTNLAWAFDKWFLNIFPRKTIFYYNEGGYATLSFIPTLATMIIGLLAGNKLHSPTLPIKKITFFIVFGISLSITGLLLHITGINPIVKRIWTPAWTIFSGGICLLLLSFFYRIVDVAGKKKWSFFLLVIGSNSIAAYLIADGGIREFIHQSLYTHLGQQYDTIFGAAYAPLVSGVLTLIIVWLILYWLYKNKIFIKI